MNIVEIRELSKIYGDGDAVKALDKVDLDIEEGKFHAVLGTSGCGKSTLLHILGGMDYATEGMVKYQDAYGSVDITELGPEDLTLFRRKQIGFIFQKYNLIPMLTTYENVIFLYVVSMGSGYRVGRTSDEKARYMGKERKTP